MFTGIVSHLGKVNKILHPDDWELLVDILDAENLDKSYNINSTPIGASISCSGICLTLKKVLNNTLFFDVSDETREKTNFSTWKVGSLINLEKSLKVGDELGGHFVYGHVDTTTVVSEILELENSWEYHFEKKFNKNNRFIVEKGSISINGISLTIAKVENDTFMISVIDHTFNQTNLKFLNKSDQVNIEFDYLARFIFNNE